MEVKFLIFVLFSSIKIRLRSNSAIGIELSGGLDSSGIAAIASILCDNTSNPFISLSHVLTESSRGDIYPYDDESKYIKEVISQYNFDDNCLISDNHRSLIGSIIENLELLNGPSIQGFSMMSTALYDKAQSKEINVLLSGFGGDEGVTSESRTILRELTLNRQWKQVKSYLKHQYSGKQLIFFKRMLRLILKSYLPILERITSFRKHPEKWQKNLYQRFALDKRFEKEWNSRSRFYDMVILPKGNTVREYQYKMLMHNHIPIRLENSYLVAHSYKIEYRYPLLDIKLLELYYSLPSTLKNANGFGRYIFRKAISAYLPDSICWKQQKMSSTIPNTQTRFLQEIENFSDLISESNANNRFHYIDYPKMTSMINQLIKRDYGKKSEITINMFVNYIKILILQKWQREGKIDIGIKC